MASGYYTSQCYSTTPKRTLDSAILEAGNKIRKKIGAIPTTREGAHDRHGGAGRAVIWNKVVLEGCQWWGENWAKAWKEEASIPRAGKQAKSAQQLILSAMFYWNTTTCTGCTIVSMAAFVLQQQSWAVKTEPVGPSKPKLFTACPLEKKLTNSQYKEKRIPGRKYQYKGPKQQSEQVQINRKKKWEKRRLTRQVSKALSVAENFSFYSEKMTLAAGRQDQIRNYLSNPYNKMTVQNWGWGWCVCVRACACACCGTKKESYRESEFIVKVSQKAFMDRVDWGLGQEKGVKGDSKVCAK